jgi:hypothetical protein
VVEVIDDALEGYAKAKRFMKDENHDVDTVAER